MAQPSSSLRADCPSCGTVDVAMDDANLVLGLDKPDMGHVLQYTCPTCSSTRTEHIDERAIRLLMAAGIGLVGSPAGSRAASDGSSSRSSG